MPSKFWVLTSAILVFFVNTMNLQKMCIGFIETSLVALSTSSVYENKNQPPQNG